MDAEAAFAEALANFQPRLNQRYLALKADECFEANDHLLAQAGCGTGKSFVGLLAAINLSKRTGKPAIYATATKALQDQIAYKDLPFLQSIFDFTFAVVKGRSNYVCRQKLSEWDGAATVQAAVDDETFSGEVLDLPNGQDIAPMVTISSEECPGKRDCPFGEVCFAERAKQRAKTANVILVNHALLANDASLKARMRASGVPEEKATGVLPPYVGGVIDEAHELEEYVTSALGEMITEASFGRLGTEVANFLGSRESAKEMLEASRVVYEVVRGQLAKRKNRSDKNYAFTAASLTALSDPIFRLLNTLTALQGKVEFTQVYGDDKKVQHQKRLTKRLANTIDKLRTLMTADFSEYVRWFNVAEGNRSESIEWAPLSVGEFLASELWSTGPFMLMSATLAVKDKRGQYDFSFIASRLGFAKYESFDAGTPFDFTKQALTYVAQLAHPVAATKEQWRAGAIATTGELVRASNGRALFLYTSKTEMNEAHRILAPMIQKMGHRVLKQGDAPNKMLAKEFSEDEHSCLFALKSFFTGIDVQGDSLRLLVIDKLPFPVPTDVVFKARCDAIDKGQNAFRPGGSFWKLTVPSMILTILQGYGRLIRTVDDWGVVAILDSRLYGKNEKNYGSVIAKALPEAPVTTTLDDAVEFLNR